MRNDRPKGQPAAGCTTHRRWAVMCCSALVVGLASCTADPEPEIDGTTTIVTESPEPAPPEDPTLPAPDAAEGADTEDGATNEEPDDETGDVGGRTTTTVDDAVTGDSGTDDADAPVTTVPDPGVSTEG